MTRFNTPSITPKRVKAPITTSSATAAKMQPAAPSAPRPKVSKAKPNTVNAAGGEAYSLSLRSEVLSTFLNSMLKGSYYQDSTGELAKLQDLVDRADKAGDLEFVAKAALFARHAHGLRTVSHVIAGELGDRARGASWKRAFYEQIVFRPDDLCEILAYWGHRHQGFRHPNAMLRGFAKRLLGFTAYHLAKYRGDGKTVSMIDAVNLCHPRPPKGHAIHDLMKGKLAAAETWEKALSAAGNTVANGELDESKEEAVAAAKGEAWVSLLAEKKLGYLACLRNLRNIAEQAPAAIDDAVALLTNAKAVAKSKVFPFQFRMAYDTLRDSDIPNAHKHLLVGAVAKAADLAVSNCPTFVGKTLIVVDDSGSMTSGGANAAVKMASLFAAVLAKANPAADYMQFSNDARYINLDTIGMGVFPLAGKIEATCANGGTNFNAIFGQARAGYDRIIILSDMQGWMESGTQGAFAAYAKRSGKVPFLYSFNLTAGNGTSQFPERQVCLLAGFSDRIFATMAQVERDPAAMVNEVAALVIGQPIIPKDTK